MEDKMTFEPQVPREHYFKGYDTKERFISYWYQINEVLKTEPKNVLEIGVGNKTVSNYLKDQGIEVKTVDIDPYLEPDYVCSVTELSKYLEENSFDTILCAEVLEHIPFKHFEAALTEMQKVAKKYVIISLPHFGIKFRLGVKIPLFNERIFLLKLPYHKVHEFDGEHHWEVGKEGYPLKLILSSMSKLFVINRCYLISENLYHVVFILDIKTKSEL